MVDGNGLAEKGKGSNPTGSTISPSEGKQSAPQNSVSAPKLSNTLTGGQWDAHSLLDMQLNEVFICATGKRWHCYYYTLVAGKPKRTRVYGGVNRTKDPQARMQQLLALQQTLQQKTLQYYFTKLLLNSGHLKKSSRHSFKVHVELFLKWAAANHLHMLQPKEITRQHISVYKNWLLKKRRNRTVNNYMESVSNAFNRLINEHEVEIKNPCRSLEKLGTTSESHIAYQDAQAVKITAWLAVNNPELLFYIRFICYVFLRCNEVRLLQIKNIDFSQMVIKMRTEDVKTNESKNKKILALFHAEILKLQNQPLNYYVFGRNKCPGPLPVGERYFSKQYRKLKPKFNLSRNHTLYGFRHTVVSMMLRNGADKYEVMKYTGHTTLAAFEKYITSIFAEPPKDLSDKITMLL